MNERIEKRLGSTVFYIIQGLGTLGIGILIGYVIHILLEIHGIL